MGEGHKVSPSFMSFPGSGTFSFGREEVHRKHPSQALPPLGKDGIGAEWCNLLLRRSHKLGTGSIVPSPVQQVDQSPEGTVS